MRRGVKSLLKVQNKCVNLSSFVQDFYPIVYNSGQLNFTTVPFPKCVLPVGQELMFIQVSHDIWAYYMFKHLTWHACQGHGAIITSKSLIPFLKEGTNVCKKPFLGDFIHMKRLLEQICKNTGPSSFASSFRTLGWSSSGPKAFEGFKPLSNLITHSVDTTILSMKGADLLVKGTSLY